MISRTPIGVKEHRLANDRNNSVRNQRQLGHRVEQSLTPWCQGDSKLNSYGRRWIVGGLPVRRVTRRESDRACWNPISAEISLIERVG